MEFDLDRIISVIEDGGVVPERDFVQLLESALEVLYMESNLVQLQSPIVICGDIHGQLYDLFELFEKAGMPAEHQFLFMGDYVDRGYYSLQTFGYLLALKLKYKGRVTLLRGNHECRQVNQMYGFYVEIQATYGHAGLWTMCNEIFDMLPMAAVIDGEVFSVHGGLSPDIPTIDKIDLIERNDELPATGPFCDLTWSDPDEGGEWRANMRGAGYLFGKKQVDEFCYLNKLKFVTRSHQVAQEGFQWFFDKKLITVWSAPNYMYRMGNRASVLRYDGNGEYELIDFDARPADKRKVPDELPQSGYFS